MLRILVVFVFLFSAVLSVINGTCSTTTTYNCDCELRYVCSDSATTHSVGEHENSFNLLTKLTGNPLPRREGVYLAGSRQIRTGANQRDYCDTLCEGRADAILGIHATNDANNRIGYEQLAKILDDKDAAGTGGKCCGVFIASKRGWCSGNNEWHYVKYNQDFTYYKQSVQSVALSTSYDFFTTDACGTTEPFPNGLVDAD